MKPLTASQRSKETIKKVLSQWEATGRRQLRSWNFAQNLNTGSGV
jgi:hypothetical protein